MRIRTDTKPYRENVIDRIAEYYGVNKTDAMINAAHDIPRIQQAITQVLEREDLTVKQKREIAETFNDNIKGTEFTINHSASIETPDE